MLNLYGNDFLHQVPTMEISTTIMDLIYVYGQFIKENQYILHTVGDKVHIEFDNMKNFFKEFAEYEQYLMLDSYTIDIENRSRISRTFGDIFSHRYMIDYKENLPLTGLVLL